MNNNRESELSNQYVEFLVAQVEALRTKIKELERIIHEKDVKYHFKSSYDLRGDIRKRQGILPRR